MQQTQARECKICYKQFASAVALAGHMRIHNLPLLPKSRNACKKSPCKSLLAQPSQVPSFHAQNSQSLLIDNSAPHLQLGGAHTICSNKKMLTYKRPKARLESKFVSASNSAPLRPVQELQVRSLDDDIFTDYDAALCLMSMSRDKWKRSNPVRSEGVAKTDQNGATHEHESIMGPNDHSKPEGDGNESVFTDS